jgi:hypothetical protein
MAEDSKPIAADSRPMQLSLTPNFAIFDRTATIEGLTLGIWSENPQAALAIGIVNGSTGQSAGLSLGVVNYADTYKGMSVGVLNYANNYKGVQGGLVNYTKKDLVGWQGGPLFGLLLSVVNYTGGTMNGFQCGVVNYAGSLIGLQFGVVNYAAKVEGGVQIGVVNIIPQNPWFTGLPEELAPGMVLVNWHF